LNKIIRIFFLGVVMILYSLQLSFAGKMLTEQHKVTTKIKIHSVKINNVTLKHQLITRDSSLTEIKATLLKLINKSHPKDLNSAQINEWERHTKWLKNVHKRLSNYHKKLNHCIRQNLEVAKEVPTESDTLDIKQKDLQMSEMQSLNQEFYTLKNSIQMESRQFLKISIILKVRHDIAMSSIRNMK